MLFNFFPETVSRTIFYQGQLLYLRQILDLYVYNTFIKILRDMEAKNKMSDPNNVMKTVLRQQIKFCCALCCSFDAHNTARMIMLSKNVSLGNRNLIKNLEK